MKHKFKLFYFLLLIPLSLVLGSCSRVKQTDIVTTLYPQYDIAKQIAGDKLTVSLMTPFGSEVHAYEPTAKDILRVQESKLFIYTSDEMERWVKNIIDDKTNAINLSTAYTLVPYDQPDAVVDDFHYWTDPTIFMQLVTVIKDEIVKVDQDNAAYYNENAINYFNEINEVHNEILAYLKTKDNPDIFFYGHNAMTSFGSRYNLNIISLSTNYQPDAELSPGQKETLKNKMIAANAEYLFVEELIDLSAPKSLKDELSRAGYNITILELHGFHNISKDQNSKGVRYVDLLRENLKNIRRALD